MGAAFPLMRSLPLEIKRKYLMTCIWSCTVLDCRQMTPVAHHLLRGVATPLPTK